MRTNGIPALLHTILQNIEMLSAPHIFEHYYIRTVSVQVEARDLLVVLNKKIKRIGYTTISTIMQ